MSTATTTGEGITRQSSGCPLHAIANWDASKTLAARLGIFAYGLASYGVFLASFFGAILFVGNWFLPKTIDTVGAAGAPALLPAMLINGGFLGAFAVQHSIMARPWFKAWFTRFVPKAMERSTFVLLASAILLLMYTFWQPMPGIVWNVQQPVLHWALVGVCLAGWGIVFFATCMVSHFDLFGLRQVVVNLAGRPYQGINFRLVGLYKIVRHPIMLGFIIAFWATPVMTAGHLFFAIMTTAYIFVGVAIEERDLVAAFGETYIDYRRRVRGILPLPRFGKGQA